MKNRVLLIFFCRFFFGWGFFLYAQTPRYFNYSVEQGLPSSETYYALQDTEGFIWISTDRGVVRYNGYEFKLYTTLDGLPTNTVFSMEQDKAGRIWFLGFHSKLAYYYQGKIVPYKFNHVLSKHISGSPNPRSLYYSTDKGLYVGYDSHGLVHIDLQGNFEILTESDSIKCSRAFIKKIDGHCLYGSIESRNGIADTHVTIEDGGLNYAERYSFGKFGILMHPVHVRRKNGHHVLAFNRHVVDISSSGIKTWMTATPAFRLYEDRDSCLWISCYRDGIKQLFPNSADAGRYKYHLLRDKSVTGILQDNQGEFWFTTLENGVYYFPQFKFLRAETPLSNPDDEVTSITGGSGQNIYVGYGNGRIEQINGTSWIRNFSIQKQKNADAHVYCLTCDTATDRVWCGYNAGVDVFDKNGQRQHLVDFFSRTVKYTGHNRLYSATNKLLMALDGKERQVLHKGNLHIEDIYITHDGSIQVATIDGLYTILPDGTALRAAGILGENRIKEIKKCGDRMVYATQGKGVVVRESEKSLIIDIKKGMASAFINSITCHGDTIWAATNKGISRIILRGNQPPYVNNFNQYNGLHTNEIKTIHRQGDIIWMGSRQGLFWFRENEVMINKKGSPVFFEEIKVNGRSLNNQTTFAHSENNFEFRFFAINYKKRGNICYRYRLRGYDDKWKQTYNRSVQYLSLPYNSYCFEVQAMNENGYWGKSGKLFRFNIIRPFYLQWWFLVLVTLLVLGIILMVVRRRIAVIKHNNQMVLLMNEYKGIALASQINPHFIFNSLNSIQSFILYEDRVNAAKYLSSFAKLMRKSLEHSRIEFVSLQDEIDLLQAYFELEQLRYKNKFTHRFEIDPNIQLEEVQVPTMILQPFIENSIRHGLVGKPQDDGLVTVRLFLEDKLLKCEIEDNGLGRTLTPPEKKTKHTSHGINITVERIKTYCRNEKTKFLFQIDDKTDALSKPAGTKIIFYLPYRKVLYETKMPDH